MLSARSWRVYRIILTMMLIIVLFPVLLMCFHSRPLADDFVQPMQVAFTWRETGSLFATIAEAFRTMVSIYFERSGIFFSMLLSAIPFSVFGVQWTWVNAVLAIALLLIAVHQLTSIMPCFCKGISKDVVSCTELLLDLAVFLFLPSYFEAIYWFSGAANYTYIIAMAICLFASVFKALIANRASFQLVALWCAGFFCLGGANWMTPTASIVLYGAIALWVVFKRKPLRLILPYAFLLAGFLVAAICPGNANRQAAMDVNIGLFEAMFLSFVKAFSHTFRDVKIFLFFLLMFPIFNEIRLYTDIQFRHALWLPALSICLIAANLFPVVYQSSYWAARHTNATFLLVVLLIPLNLFWLFGWLLQRTGAPKRAHIFSGRRLLAAAMAVLLSVGMMSVPDLSFSPLRFSCQLQPATIALQLLSGEAKEYSEWYDYVVEELRANPDEDIEINSMLLNEILNPLLLFGDNPQDWYNKAFSDYYGENCTIRYVP